VLSDLHWLSTVVVWLCPTSPSGVELFSSKALHALSNCWRKASLSRHCSFLAYTGTRHSQ